MQNFTFCNSSLKNRLRAMKCGPHFAFYKRENRAFSSPFVYSCIVQQPLSAFTPGGWRPSTGGDRSSLETPANKSIPRAWSFCRSPLLQNEKSISHHPLPAAFDVLKQLRALLESFHVFRIAFRLPDDCLGRGFAAGLIKPSTKRILHFHRPLSNVS